MFNLKENFAKALLLIKAKDITGLEVKEYHYC
jgi:hypothetical protein|nr:MAG TPA: hypothetical protein [Caudoviricetes sp.]